MREISPLVNLDVKFSLIISFLGKITLEKKKNKSIMYYNMKKYAFTRAETEESYGGCD